MFTLMTEKIIELENKLANAYFEIESGSDEISIESGLTVNGYKKAIVSLVNGI